MLSGVYLRGVGIGKFPGATGRTFRRFRDGPASSSNRTFLLPIETFRGDGEGGIP